MYKNSLILRIAMTEKPFIHKWIYILTLTVKDFAKTLKISERPACILNVGGKRKTIYDFVKKSKRKIKSISINKVPNFPVDSSLNVDKYNKILKINK